MSKILCIYHANCAAHDPETRKFHATLTSYDITDLPAMFMMPGRRLMRNSVLPTSTLNIPMPAGVTPPCTVYRSSLAIGDEVTIDKGDVKGYVVEILFSGVGGKRIQILVSWIANGTPQQAWFDEFRLGRSE
jgi:hypothetical protein